MSMARALRSPVADAAVDAYDRHVGRYGAELAREMVRVTGVRAGQRALDVGCGTGALTVMLAEVLGAGNVAATVHRVPICVWGSGRSFPGATPSSTPCSRSSSCTA